MGAGTEGLERRLAAQARRLGPLPFSAFMEAALYDEDDGFFASGHGAGRKADFVTSPEIGPLFAAVMSRALDAWWDELGRPDPYLVIEAGAGTGTLARDIVGARPACLPALRYVLVERSQTQRELAAAQLPLELPALVLGPASPGPEEGDDEEAVHRVPNAGPLMTALADLPAVPVTGVVFANELLDNLPTDLLEWRDGAWQEVRVAAVSGTDALAEVLVPAPPDLVEEVGRFAGAASPAEGARIPLQRAAAAWVRRALDIVSQGRLLVIDYADRTPDLARRPWREWLRTYRGHRTGGVPLSDPGTQDLTCEVAIDQLVAAAGPPRYERSQAEFLKSHGIEVLAAEARAAWHRRAHVGDLEALKARSRADEADALCDPEGLGAFTALEWVV